MALVGPHGSALLNMHDIEQSKYCAPQVMALVGPHGSALPNMHWAAPGATVLELMAAGQRNNEVFWLIATGLGHNYWALPVDIYCHCCDPLPFAINLPLRALWPQLLGAAGGLMYCCSILHYIATMLC